jgi:uncharacterized MAPEG superfamily protein
MTPELKYLALTATFTALMWVPYILNVILNNRINDAVGYPAAPLKMVLWAERLKKAHYNAVENLVVFASLVLVANAADISNAATVSAAAVFFWARLVYAIVYAAGIPWIRTLSFAVGWGAILCIAWQVLLA